MGHGYRLIALTVKTVAERPSRRHVAVVAGTGTNDTAATIAATPPCGGARGRRRARRCAGITTGTSVSRMFEAHFQGSRRRGRAFPIVLYRHCPSRTRLEHRRRHVPAARRAPPRRRGRGGEQQSRGGSPGSARDRPPQTWPFLASDGQLRRCRSWPSAATAFCQVASWERDLRPRWPHFCAAARANGLRPRHARIARAPGCRFFLANFRGESDPISPVKAALARMGPHRW